MFLGVNDHSELRKPIFEYGCKGSEKIGKHGQFFRFIFIYNAYFTNF